jgi:hypothetical protein
VNVSAVWDFIAGESRRAPLGVAIAVITAVAVTKVAPNAGAWVGVMFVAILVAGLIAGVFEKT